jgi:hypothetical protein
VTAEFRDERHEVDARHRPLLVHDPGFGGVRQVPVGTNAPRAGFPPL